MRTRLLFLLIGVPLCIGASCDISCFPGGIGPTPNPGVSIALDQANCVMTITQEPGKSEIEITAVITSNAGEPVALDTDQAVTVNGDALVATDTPGVYTHTMDEDSEYVIRVVEPSIGVKVTTIDAIDEFTITSPEFEDPASLQGFTLEWSNPNPNLTTQIRMEQTLFDADNPEVVNLSEQVDTGSRVLSADDLATFRQGADIVITITKMYQQNLINGFATAEFTLEFANRGLVTPGA